jgi:rod shape-determining protein MreB
MFTDPKGMTVCGECFFRNDDMPQSEEAESTYVFRESPEQKPPEQKMPEPSENEPIPSIHTRFGAPELSDNGRRSGSVFRVFSSDMAIDLGTVNTLIYMKGKGIVLNEPSVVAMRISPSGERAILAVGREAKEMLGKTPANIIAIRPMRDGVVADFEAAEAMLKFFIRKVRRRLALLRPRMVIAVPTGTTPVERVAVEESAKQAGAREVHLVEEPLAAAIGASMPISEPRCNIVVDIGGGTTEVAVISMGGIVAGRSLRVAGDKMDAALVRFIRRKYNFVIGEQTAEMVKMCIGNAVPDLDRLETIEVKGWEIVSGKPRILRLDSTEVLEALSEQIDDIVEAIRNVLDRTPQELAADVLDSGIVLTGGGSLLSNLDRFLEQLLEIPVHVSPHPLLTVAMGTGRILDDRRVFKQIIDKVFMPNRKPPSSLRNNE